jgi:hypothetical protein
MHRHAFDPYKARARPSFVSIDDDDFLLAELARPLDKIK